MKTDNLPNKPLQEAIFEIRWELPQPSGPTPHDPNYNLLIGRFYDRIQQDYPLYEALPSSEVPDLLVPYLVQHRFRPEANTWPVVQLGPGVLTVNETTSYTWENFSQRTLSAFNNLIEAYPNPSDLHISNAILRYIDAINLDPTSEDLFKFLEQKLHTRFQLPQSLFRPHRISASPTGLNVVTTFHCTDPEGAISLRFATGAKNNEPALILETIVQSSSPNAPREPTELQGWLDAGHKLIHSWFFDLIEGDLERTFRSE